MREKQVVLEDHPYLPLFGRYVDSFVGVIERAAAQCDPTLVDREEPGQRRHRGGLARSIRSQEGNGPARWDGELQFETE